LTAPDRVTITDKIRAEIAKYTETGIPVFARQSWGASEIIRVREDFSHEQAWAKLAVIVSKANGNIEEMKRLVSADCSGEIDLGGNPKKINVELIRVVPSTTIRELEMAIRRLVKLHDWHKKFLLIEGLGDGHLRLGPLSSGERVTLYLKDGFKEDPNSSVNLTEEERNGLINLAPSNVLKEKSLEEINRLFTELLKGDKAKASLIIRDALCFNDEVLKTLRQAIEEYGINVIMHTKVSMSSPNLTQYDLGCILEAIGVEASNEVNTKGVLAKLALKVVGFEV
jgi:hypothetical protein